MRRRPTALRWVCRLSFITRRTANACVHAVLHPSYKISYFQKAGWPPEWIHVAEDLVRKQFNSKYTDIPVPKADGGNSTLR